MKSTFHREILWQAINDCGWSLSEVTRQSGVNTSSLSRFFSGKQDLQTSDYFSALQCLPEHVRNEALAKLGLAADGKDVKSLILSLSAEDKAIALETIALWVLQSKQNRVNTDIAELQPAV